MITSTPALTRHVSGMGCVRLSGLDHYSKGCSKWQPSCTPPRDIVAWYDRQICEWQAAGRVVVKTKSPTVAIIVAAFLTQAKRIYSDRPREGHSELNNFKDSVATLLGLYKKLPALEFSPKKLKAVRSAMIEEDLARTTINSRIRRVKQIFAWAVEEELLPGSVHHALSAVKGLRRGRSEARESKRILPASMKDVQAAWSMARPEIQAMILLQLRSGMRPGEVCRMTPGQVDRSRKIWVYLPDRHKSEHHGKEREIYLSKRAQAILTPFLERSEDKPCFMTAKPRRGKAKAYTTRTYQQYIERLCKRAKVQQWSPNQLRHNAGTRFRRKFGLEIARVLLGHSKVETTQIYAEVDRKKAIQAMKESR